MIVTGDLVIFDGARTTPSLAHRLYGVVVGVSAHHATIATADGALYVREHQSVAVFVQPPDDWEHLYKGVERFVEIRESLVEHSKRPRRRKATAPA